MASNRGIPLRPFEEKNDAGNPWYISPSNCRHLALDNWVWNIFFTLIEQVERLCKYSLYYINQIFWVGAPMAYYACLEHQIWRLERFLYWIWWLVCFCAIHTRYLDEWVVAQKYNILTLLLEQQKTYGTVSISPITNRFSSSFRIIYDCTAQEVTFDWPKVQIFFYDCTIGVLLSLLSYHSAYFTIWRIFLCSYSRGSDSRFWPLLIWWFVKWSQKFYSKVKTN